MHFSIPDTQEFFNETTGSAYTGYNIYINDIFHCCLRYKQLLNLHEQLRRQLQQLETLDSGIVLPSFPPKKFLPLSNSQVEQRRAALEHYLQLIGQVPALAKLELFETFLLNAQHESAAAEAALNGRDFAEETILEVVLMNGYKIQLQCHSSDNTSAVLNRVCKHINLPAELIPFFCIYVVRKDSKESIVMIRRLMDFEAPVITVQQINTPHLQLVLRKGYWSPTYDLQLMRDNVGLNLLFIQTVSDVEREWIISSSEVRQQLHKLQELGQKREYMELVRKLPLYGCLQFTASSVDFPTDVLTQNTSALIAIGNSELSIRTFHGAKIYETKFRVTRMRRWRVTSVHQSDLEEQNTSASSIPDLQLSFEYLMSRQTLRWITMTSTQAMLMSVCLQSMVDELLQQKAESVANNESMLTSVTQPRFGSIRSLSCAARKGSHTIHSYTPKESKNITQDSKSKTKVLSTPSPTYSSLSAYSSTSPTVFFRNAEESIHNEAFEEIGDDDL